MTEKLPHIVGLTNNLYFILTWSPFRLYLVSRRKNRATRAGETLGGSFKLLKILQNVDLFDFCSRIRHNGRCFCERRRSHCCRFSSV